MGLSLSRFVGSRGDPSCHKRSFQDAWSDLTSQEDYEIFQDPDTGDYYFIDPETGDEYDCDEFGNPLED